ncbi:Lsr2 family protein (plasmid) [Nocardia sp. NBC_01377]|uniref:histone-like nucleoid-structuring protein Lsr2 n=1 Tax=Nocardia sp. NBC_01377 TaxID=2903595 RepID=UPI002F91915D
MAKSTVTVTRDDWTGDIVEPTDIAPTQVTTFTFNGREYSLDLSLASAEELEATLTPWMKKASRVTVVGRRARQGGRVGPSQSEEANSQSPNGIREWARNNGFPISPRGRIPESVIKAYQDRDDTLPGSVDDGASDREADVETTSAAAVSVPASEPQDEHSGDAPKPTAAERAAIRQWALDQGRDVKSRGPLSPELIRDYRQALTS